MGNAYFRCFYITMKTAISVGMNVKPDRELAAEMIFMGTLWLLGIFVFAVLIGKNRNMIYLKIHASTTKSGFVFSGNVKDIIAQGTRSQDEFMFKFDQVRALSIARTFKEFIRTKMNVKLKLIIFRLANTCTDSMFLKKLWKE